MRAIKRIYIVLLLVTIGLSIGHGELLAQNSESESIEHDSKREEVQRYFGYEALIYRYLSLPYDASMNINEHGSFVEIGFLYLMFIPILLVLLAARKTKALVMAIIAPLILWVISTGNSFVFSQLKSKIPASHENIADYLTTVSFSQEPFTHLTAWLYKFSLILYAPFEAFAKTASGDQDGITYPILVIMLVAGSWLVHQNSNRLENSDSIMVKLFFLYGFFWMSFSGGIIWYGYILLILGYFFILFLFRQLKRSGNVFYRPVFFVFLGLSIVWITMGYFNRISNIGGISTESELGKGLFNPVFYEYGLGKINKDQALDKIYANASGSIKRINQFPEANVLRIGTSFTYFIDNNTERVLMDNQLGIFYELSKRYQDKTILAKAMKASEIKFIIIDLNTAQIDKTPNKTLTEKYKVLLNFVYNNPGLQLIATDRVLKRTSNSNNLEYFYGVFGDIQYPGQYAVYEIL